MLNKNLVKLRKKSRLTQYQLAEKLGFSRGQIANYEQGKREPDYDTLGKLADFFEVDINYLLGREKKEIIQSLDELDVLMFSDKEGFDELSDDEKKEIKDMINDQLDFLIQRRKKDK